MPVIKQINTKRFSTYMKVGGKIYKVFLNSVKNMYIMINIGIIKRHFTCTSANDDSLSTIKWDNLA